MFGESFITGDGEFAAGRFPVDALGEDPPRNRLWDDDASSQAGRQFACEDLGVL
jgi:hypothetical protein